MEFRLRSKSWTRTPKKSTKSFNLEKARTICRNSMPDHCNILTIISQDPETKSGEEVWNYKLEKKKTLDKRFQWRKLEPFIFLWDFAKTLFLQEEAGELKMTRVLGGRERKVKGKRVKNSLNNIFKKFKLKSFHKILVFRIFFFGGGGGVYFWLRYLRQ